MSLPPWIRSIKRPLETLVVARSSFADLPDTEPGEDAAEQRSRVPAAQTPCAPAPAAAPARAPALMAVPALALVLRPRAKPRR